MLEALSIIGSHLGGGLEIEAVHPRLSLLGARRSFELMVREHTYVPLPSMNGEFMVIDDPSDVGLAYHQALAMVLYLIDQRGERGIALAVQYLREGGDPDALRSGVGAPLDGEALLSFLARRLR